MIEDLTASCEFIPAQEIREGDRLYDPDAVWHDAPVIAVSQRMAVRYERDGKVVEWNPNLSEVVRVRSPRPVVGPLNPGYSSGDPLYDRLCQEVGGRAAQIIAEMIARNTTADGGTVWLVRQQSQDEIDDRDTSDDEPSPSETSHTVNGEALRVIRERSGLSQSALARESGVSQSRLSVIETGMVRCRPATVIRLANGLKVSVLALVVRPESGEGVAPVEPSGSHTSPTGAAPSTDDRCNEYVDVGAYHVAFCVRPPGHPGRHSST